MGTKCVPAPNTFSQVQEKDDYDFGATSPSRQTITAYQRFSGTLGTIADAPCKTVVYDATGKPATETDYLYDGGSVVCANAGSTAVTSAGGLSLTGHDETNYGAGSTTPRGNLTGKIQRLSGGTSPTTTYAYDETGQITSSTDPNGSVTQYSHADQFLSTNTGSYTTTAGSPPNGQVTNAYLTQVTHPSTTTSHIEGYTYGYNDGEVTTATDQSQMPLPTTTTYRYNDLLGRLNEVDYPDQGQTNLNYNDVAPSPSVKTTRKQTSTTNIVSVDTMDGMGHETQTQLNAPEGPITSESTYTGMGWILTRTNAHRSTASATDGTTTYSYDALGRTTTVTQPDNSIIHTVYATNCSPNTNAYLLRDGRFKKINDPQGVGGTIVSGINATGVIVGQWLDGNGVSRGMVYCKGTFTTHDDPNGAGGLGTGLYKINAEGDIAGWYTDRHNQDHGFLLRLGHDPCGE